MTDHLRDAIFKAGGVSKLAKALRVTRSAVSQWQEEGRQTPAKHCVKIEQLTGVSRHKLRPDVFGKEDRPQRREEMQPTG